MEKSLIKNRRKQEGEGEERNYGFSNILKLNQPHLQVWIAIVSHMVSYQYIMAAVEMPGNYFVLEGR